MTPDYQLPLHFTGKIANLTFRLRSKQLTEDDYKVMDQYVIKLTGYGSDQQGVSFK
jgi:hypothetical protein